MSDLASAKLYVQTESVVTRQPVSESMLQTMGGSVNWLLDYTIFKHEFTMNNIISSFSGKNFVDGIKAFPATGNWQIIGQEIYGATMGTSGITQLDVQYAAQGTNVWTSIFSTLPSIASTATGPITIYDGDTSTGCVAGVLTSYPLLMPARTMLRMNCISTQTNGAQNFGIKIFWQGAP